MSGDRIADIVVFGGRVITMAESDVAPDGVTGVAVADGAILALGDRAALEAASAPAPR
jgi:predicted amidohydrolase YtcJ